MRPTDVTLGTFEEKIRQSISLAGVSHLTDREVAAVKDRIRFVLFDSNPAELTVAQIAEWVRRVIPSMRRTSAIVEAHADLSDGIPVTADLLPPSLKQKARTAPQQDETLAAGEVLCSLMGDRKVRFNPASMVVTPMRLEDRE
jgi:hypothetical protein